MGRQSRVSTQILDALLIQEKPNVVVLDEVKKCSMLKLLTSFVLTFFFSLSAYLELPRIALALVFFP